jgi:hypothetical protein
LELKMTDLVVQEPRHVAVARRTLFDLSPKDQVAFATDVANVLTDVIDRQKLYTMIQGKKHVRVEGWSTMGTLLGVLPRESRVIEHADGSFEAYVDLINSNTGLVVGGGSALCSIDEPRWGSAPKFSRRSMAITRATGKAYRLAFSWIITMAGYEATPYEEMPDVGAATGTGRGHDSHSGSPHQPFISTTARAMEPDGPGHGAPQETRAGVVGGSGNVADSSRPGGPILAGIKAEADEKRAFQAEAAKAGFTQKEDLKRLFDESKRKGVKEKDLPAFLTSAKGIETVFSK